MKIDLYTNEKIFTFTLPSVMQGIYKFDMDKEQSYKLINIEARDNNWVLYSTPYVNVLEGNVEFNYCNVSDNFEIEVLIKTRNMKIREKIYR